MTQLLVLQAGGGPGPAAEVREEVQVEVDRLSARLNKGVLPQLPEPGLAQLHWGTCSGSMTSPGDPPGKAI